MSRKLWPLLASIVIYLVIVYISYWMSIRQNDGHLVYALDDPYIHMSIAKNCAEYGVWGVTKHGFSSSSSAPLWTALLSVSYMIFGISDLMPLILNVLCGILVLIVVYRILIEYTASGLYLFLVMSVIMFCTPLISVGFTGMEHILHILLSIIILYLGASVIVMGNQLSKELILLCLLSPILVLTRYEGLFLIFVLLMLLLIRKKWLPAVFLVVFSTIPMTLYGFYSVMKGWYLLPNSVLLKGNIPDYSSAREIFFFFYIAARRLVENSHLLILVLGAAAVTYFKAKQDNSIWNVKSVIGIVFIAVCYFHLLLAGTGWFFRYEAYLVAMGLLFLGLALIDYTGISGRWRYNRTDLVKYLIGALFIFALISPFIMRASKSLLRIQQATKNIYEQQYQMGRFLDRYYRGQSVAVNDIGAVNYITDIRCLDLWGLASYEVASALLSNSYDSNTVINLTKSHDVKIAILYENWHEATESQPFKIPWEDVGQWKIVNNKVCGNSEVSFYAVNALERENLVNYLRDFSASLPDDVIQSGIYTE
jgi:hypothetical protein